MTLVSFRRVFSLIIAGALFLAAGAARAAERGGTITVAQTGPADVIGSDSAALQRAADLVRPGGVLSIGPGTYQMDNSLFVPSGITVRGTRGQTILRKSAGVESALVEDGDYGERQLTVAEPQKFRAGMGIAIVDDMLKSDWDVTVTTVAQVEGDVLRLRSMALRDYNAERHHAKVRNTFPVLCAIDTQDVVLEDLIVDGNRAENVFLDGCRGGAIYSYQSSRLTIRNCVAKNYNGDGISFQMSDDVQVLGCESFGNAGHGVHPGAGSKRPRVTGCRLRENGQVGLFLCWRVVEGAFEANVVENNTRYGISIGHKDTDNVFVGNTVSRNGIAGVYFRKETFRNSGHRNTFRDNTILDNGSADKGYGFLIDPFAGELTLIGNRIAETRAGAERTQRYGVYRGRGVGAVRLEANTMTGHLEQDHFVDERK